MQIADISSQCTGFALLVVFVEMSQLAEFIFQLLLGVVSVRVIVFWIPIPNATLLLVLKLDKLIVETTVSCKTASHDICLRKAPVSNIGSIFSFVTVFSDVLSFQTYLEKMCCST